MVWLKAGVLGSDAKLTGRFGRSGGPGGHVVPVAATHGMQEHAETPWRGGSFAAPVTLLTCR